MDALSPSLVNENKNSVASVITFCVDGYYKLTDINGYWLEHYVSGPKAWFQNGSWLEMFQVLEVFLIHFVRHLKSLKVEHVWLKSSALKVLQLHSTTVFLSWCELDILSGDVCSTWYLISSLVKWKRGCLTLFLYYIPPAVHLIFTCHSLHLFIRFMNVCERAWG